MARESTADIAHRQHLAATRHVGSPARLLAGPGTGKTWSLTQRVIWLIKTQGVLPNEILVLTFTRAAAQELRNRVRAALGVNAVLPHISTLHSYALSQLLHNQDRFENLPKPLRIVDDWEERWIIQEDLKDRLKLRDPEIDVRAIRQLLADLSSDWETLRADEQDWEQTYPNPEFLAEWRRHRTLYAYTMRSELVYQLKRALFQIGDFDLDGIPRYVLVDEYQDLNPCDLSIVNWLSDAGAEVYAAGDDDQSIYGFRHAHPLGIRTFATSYPGSTDLRLEICQRCDPSILQLADFVIRSDLNRVAKTLRPQDDREPGEVRLARHTDQFGEARAIAQKCAALLSDGLEPHEILILLRQDRNGVFSSLLRQQLSGIADAPPVHVEVGEPTPLDIKGGRQLLALLRLAVYGADSIAWRTLIQLDDNGLGKQAIAVIQNAALEREQRFSDVLLNSDEPSAFGPLTARIREYVAGVQADVTTLRDHLDTSREPDEDQHQVLLERLYSIEKPLRIASAEEFANGIEEFIRTISPNATTLERVIRERGTSKDDEEQVLEPGAINILTMHKAKGLGADTVFVAGAEDEFIPGRAETAANIDEERRLLYVSLTRARHRLYITYCDNRTGGQSFAGRRRSTGTGHSLTRFLRDSPLRPRPLV